MRKRWLAVGALAAFGCQTMVAPDPHIAADLPVVPSEQDPGRRVNPPLFDDAPADHLALAAECTGRGDQPAAASHLERYVCSNPAANVETSSKSTISWSLPSLCRDSV